MFAVCRRLLINRFRLIVFSTNVRASGTLKFGYEGILKILPRNAHGTYKVACTKCSCMVLSLYKCSLSRGLRAGGIQCKIRKKN